MPCKHPGTTLPPWGGGVVSLGGLDKNYGYTNANTRYHDVDKYHTGKLK